MKLIVTGSSSDGNGYILKADTGECLLIEAGIPFLEVKKALDFQISGIAGCLISHAHGDHFGRVKEYMKSAVVCYCSEATMSAYYSTPARFRKLKSGIVAEIGDFKVIPFELLHDAPCYGYFINHPECGNVLFATDTCTIDNRFAQMNNILIECNFSESVLDKNTLSGRITAVQRKRTLESHLSFEKCLQFLMRNDLSAVNNIVLIHLSDTNSLADGFQSEIAKATGKTVHIAEKGLEIEFNKTPF